MPTVKIVHKKKNLTLEAAVGELLRDVLIRGKAAIAFPCGGEGICGKCKVRVDGGGDVPEGTELETLGAADIKKGVRLACRARVAGDMSVRIIEHTIEEKILEVGSERGVEFDPCIKAGVITVPEPTLADPVPDAERILRLTGRSIRDLRLLQKLPGLVRADGGRLEIVYKGDTIIDLRAPGKGLFGVAVDIGTTTVAATLVNMQNGRHIHNASMKNPQEPYGGDVVSRIRYCTDSPARLAELAGVIREGINTLVGELCAKQGIGRDEIYDLVAVGNTVMNHLFLAVDPAPIAVAPYVPAHKHGVAVSAAAVGIELNPQGEVFAAPNIAGFVGGDTVAGILDGGLMTADKPLVLVDIGTNGEVALGDARGITACSTAAGPAFEGVNIRHGMRAGRGAIERVQIDADGRVQVRTIANEPARGICGSGIIDVVAEMVRCGIVDATGRFREPGEIAPALAGRVRVGADGQPEFEIVPAGETAIEEPITVTQKDIREIQLAKAALAAGIRILLEKAGLTARDVSGLLLAGAFGNYIRKEAALGIGLFPGFAADQIRFIGNAAGYGAVMMLLSRRELARADELRDKCRYIEVGALPEFQERFVDEMMFPGPAAV